MRYAIFWANGKPYICETFFDSLHLQRRPTGHITGQSILLLLQRNGIDLYDCCAQAHDVGSAMSSEASGSVSVIKKEQPLALYTQCRNHTLNLAISHNHALNLAI